VRLAARSAWYTPVAADAGAYLRAVYEATQGGFTGQAAMEPHGPVTGGARLAAQASGNTGAAKPGFAIGQIADADWTTNFLTASPHAIRAGQWVQVDLGAERTLTRYRLRHTTSTLIGYPPFRYVVEASRDQLAWTELALPAGPEDTRVPGNGDVFLPATVRARYLRLRATTDSGAGWNVYGLEGWGF